jgi:hypothetical protein
MINSVIMDVHRLMDHPLMMGRCMMHYFRSVYSRGMHLCMVIINNWYMHSLMLYDCRWSWLVHNSLVMNIMVIGGGNWHMDIMGKMVLHYIMSSVSPRLLHCLARS